MTTEMMYSPITGSTNVKLIKEIAAEDVIQLYKSDVNLDVERIFANQKNIYIYECSDTGYRFYYPFTLIGDSQFYQELLVVKHEKPDSYFTTIRFEHEFAITKVSTGDKVLDIGCGEGFFLEAIKNKTENISGLEFYDKAIEICTEKGISVFKEKIEEHDKNGYYDMVTAFQVLEHVADISSFIKNSLRVLRRGGKLIIAVPNNNPYYQRNNIYSTLNLPPHHMGIWNESSLKKMGDYFGLTIKDVRYNKPVSLRVDAYLMAKRWVGVKSSYLYLSVLEKAKIASLLPLSFLFSLAYYAKRKVQGDSIVVEFEYL